MLLNEDPLYAEFAAARHTDAIVGTMHVLHMLQKARLPVTPVTLPASDPIPETEPEAETQTEVQTEVQANLPEVDAADRAMAKAQARNLTADE